MTAPDPRHPVDRGGPVSATFPARFPGQCGACGERIHEGDGIRYSAESWPNFIHDDCDDRKPMPERVHPVCDVCWLTHPEGACER